MKKNIYKIEILVACVALVIFILFPIRWDNYQPVLLSGIISIFLFKAVFKNYEFHITNWDLSWILFILISFFSYFWSIDGSLVWFPSFIWLSLFIWLLIIRNLYLQEKFQPYFCYFFLFLFYLILAQKIIFLCLSYNPSPLFFPEFFVKVMKCFISDFPDRIYRRDPLLLWNFIFGYNANFVTTYILSLLPFFLFHPIRKYNQIIKLLVCLLVAYLIFKGQAKGAGIIFFIILFYYSFHEFYYSEISNSFLFLPFLIIVSCFSFFHNDLIDILLNFKSQSLSSDRFYMIAQSYRIFQDNPFFGIGSGNWHLQAYTNPVDNFPLLNDSRLVMRPLNHNLYSQILSELGIFGLISFIIPFYLCIETLILNYKSSTCFQKSLSISIIVYLMASVFYLNANGFPTYFSKLQLLAFSCLGILSAHKDIIFSRNSSIKFILVIFAFVSFLWFNYFTITANKYQETCNSCLENINECINKLKLLHNPIIINTQFVHRSTRNITQSIPLQLAQLHQKKGEYDEAEKYYEQALKYAPHDSHVLLNYARFLVRIRGNITTAEEYVKKIQSIQKNFIETDLLLAEMAIQKGNYNEAQSFFGKLGETNLFPIQLEILENQFYQRKANLDLFTNYKDILSNLEFEFQYNYYDYLKQSRKNAIDSLKNWDLYMFKKLDKEVFLNYLSKKKDQKIKFEKILRIQFMQLNLTLDQKKELLDLISQIKVEEIYYNLKMTKLKKGQNDDEIKELELSQKELETKWMKEVGGILDNKQYETYAMDRIEKQFQREFNQLKKISLKREIYNRLKFLIKNYYFLDLLGSEENTNISIDILSILNEKEIIRFKRIFPELLNATPLTHPY